jgi:hypothetical protein
MASNLDLKDRATWEYNHPEVSQSRFKVQGLMFKVLLIGQLERSAAATLNIKP